MSQQHEPGNPSAETLRVANLSKLEHRELRSTKTGEAFSLSAVLTEALGIGSFFVHHDVIPPGRRASATHFHTSLDEIVVVLSGRVRAWHAGREVELGEGDVIAFPAGPDHAHHVANDGPGPASILVIASHAPDDTAVSVPG